MQGAAPGREPHAVAGFHAPDPVDAGRERRLGVEDGPDRGQVGVPDLHDRAGLLAEQRRHRIGAQRVEIDFEPRTAREPHLQHASGEPAVGAVVVRRGQPPAPQSRQRPEQRGERLGPVEVGRGGAEALVGERERGSAEPVRSVPEIDEQQRRLADVRAQHRHQAQACILDRCERGDDRRDRRDHLALARVVAPRRAHRQRVLPDRDRDAEGGAELHRHRLDRVEEIGVLPRLPAGGHPVRRKHHAPDVRHVRGRDVGERLRHRHPAGRPRIEQGERRAFSHRHRLPRALVEAAQGDRAVGDRHLPGTHHLIAGDESADGAVADGHQERLVRHRRHAQHPFQGGTDLESAGVERPPRTGHADGVAVHAREIAEQGRHRHRDRGGIEFGVTHFQLPDPRRFTHVRPRASLALAQRREFVDAPGVDGEDVAFLGLVAPDLQRRHPGVVAGDGAKLDPSTPSCAVEQLGQRVGQSAGAHVVDGEDQVVRTPLPAAIDHLLAAALHLGVLALHGGEVEQLLSAARSAGRRGAAAEADAHGGSAQHDETRARRDVGLADLVGADAADPARDHDGLVVAVDPRAAAAVSLLRDRPEVHLEGAEVAAEGGAPELVVECGGADRAVEHDFERGGDVRGPAAVVFPGLDEARDPQVRDGEAGDTGLAAGAAPRRRLVADLAAGARRRTREGRDRGGVVVGLHLHQDLHPPGRGRVPPGVRIRNEPARRVPARHGRVVAVRGQDIARAARLGVANHVEQRPPAPHAVDGPGRVEDLVAAVLGVHLREHHQLGIGRIPTELEETRPEVVDLLRTQGEAQGRVRIFQGSMRVRAEPHHRVGRRRSVEEERRGAGVRRGRGPQECPRRPGVLRHAVMEHPRLGDRSRGLTLVAAGLRDRPRDAALDAGDAFQGAVTGDVGGLARPRGDRSRPRRHHDRGVEHRRGPLVGDERRVEQLLESPDDPVGSVAGAGEVDPAPVEVGDPGPAHPCVLHQTLAAERRQGGASPEQQEVGDGRGRRVHVARAMILESHLADVTAPGPGHRGLESGVVASGRRQGDRTMTDDRIVKDSARDPEREALGSMRGGLRAAAKKAVRKVAKKAGRKKVAKKAAATAGKTTARGATPAKRTDRAARSAAEAPASGPAGARAPAGAAKSRAPKAVAGPEAASESAVAASVAPSREPGPSIDTLRPPGPMHPGAVMDSMQEQSGGLGGLLALWGPLIIVGFLVLVFRGGDEPETAVAAGTDASDPATIDATAGTARAAAPSGATPGTAQPFDGGFAMRTSMAGPPVLAGRGAGAGVPAVAPGTLYPSPPGPYRDPRYRSLPTGESWSADATGEWMWSAEARAGSRPAAGGDAPVRWVRCEAPYYWCPAPTSPAW